MLSKYLDKRKDLQNFLFIRGFLITDNEIENTAVYPFYNNWKKEKHGEYWYMAHKIDKIFAEYIKKFEYDKIPDCYPPAVIQSTA